MAYGHVFLITHPVQGHINPPLQFASRHLGIHVTTLHGHRRMLSTGGGHPTSGLTFVPFSDGHGDEGYKPGDNPRKYLQVMKSLGSKTLEDIVATATDDGCPTTQSP